MVSVRKKLNSHQDEANIICVSYALRIQQKKYNKKIFQLF